MPIKLQIRRGTASAWSSASPAPVLLQGEIGYETDTGNFKVGDGTTAWASLPYTLPHKTGNVVNTPSILSIDQTNSRLGIGTTTPLSQVHVESAAPIVRLRDSGSPGATHVLLDADNVDGSLTISADPGATGTAASKINLATDGTTRATIDENGRLGIGTQTPSTDLHISTAAPIIRLTDTGAATAYSEISQDNTSGTLVISADETAAAAGSSLNLRTDGTNRVIIDNTGMTVVPPINPSGGFVSGTIATAALANGAVTKIKLGTDVGYNLFEQRYVTGTTGFTVPANVFQIEVFICGGGGGCVSQNAGVTSYFGGFPAAFYGVFDVVPGSTTNAVVGTGGTTHTTAGSVTAGGASSFAGISCAGGAVGTTLDTQPVQGTVTISAAPTGFTRVSARDAYGVCPFGYHVFGFAGAFASAGIYTGSQFNFSTEPPAWQSALQTLAFNQGYAARILFAMRNFAGIGAAGCNLSFSGPVANSPGTGGAVIVRYILPD